MLEFDQSQTAIKFLTDFLEDHDESNKFLKGFWFKTLKSATKTVNDIKYTKILEERRDGITQETSENYFLCFYCKKISEDDKIEYLDIIYEEFGPSKADYYDVLERMNKIYQNYELSISG